MSRDEIQDIYPLSPMQEGMLFHSLYAPDAHAYFEQSSWRLDGPIDLPALEQAWHRVVERHTALRSAFVWDGVDHPLQIVYRNVTLPIETRDWRHLSESAQVQALDAFLAEDRAQGFDLAFPPLMRLAILRLRDDALQLVWSHHHLLLDGWSVPLVMRDVMACYEAYRQGQAPYLPLARPYRDYIAWLQSQDRAAAEDFWRERLRGFTACTPLTVDRHNVVKTDEYGIVQHRLSADATTALQEMARRYHITLNTILQGAWALLLSRYSGQQDIVFGATVSGRPAEIPDVESIVGLFINTLPVRVSVDPDARTVEWLNALQSQQIEARTFEFTPLAEIHRWSDVLPGSPLFESILVFENYPIPLEDTTGRNSVRIDTGPAFTRTNYPLTLAVSPGESLGLMVGFEHDRFDEDTIQRLLEHLVMILSEMPMRAEDTLRHISILTDAERQQLLVDWNATEMLYADDSCIHHLFEAQVGRTPDATALVDPRGSLTYQDLDRQATYLAHQLQQAGVGADTLVGICTPRCNEMIVAILATLKAGGAYVPLDPTYPPERLAFMLQDTKAPIIIAHRSVRENLPASDAQVIWLDTLQDHPNQPPAHRLTRDVDPDNLAYVIYTSGSTGQPKGVLLTHRGLCNLIPQMIAHYGLEAGDRILQFLSPSFDASVIDIFATLTTGATLYLADQETLLSMDRLLALLQAEHINAIQMAPSMLRLLDPDKLPELTTVVSGGEACPPEMARRWAQDRRFINAYGPTEATVTTSLYQVESVSPEATSIPIGRPIGNVHVHVLDEELRLVPVGVPGELYVSGLGLARGYLNRPELTAERFVPNPSSEKPGARMYRTGDLVRWNKDGTLDFMGRADDQVKMRGYRIELGEIEAVLHEDAAIESAAVALQQDGTGTGYLTAYLVPKDNKALDTNVLRQHLAARLPAYMVPSVLVTLDALPLLPSGKVNRSALPAPTERVSLTTMYVAPRTPVELALADMWMQLLGIARIGIQGDFYELGGHSLLATQLASRIREVFQLDLALREVMQARTIGELAQLVEAGLRANSGVQAPAIKPVARDGDLPLSFAQQRLWFLDQLAPGHLSYGIPIAFRLRGTLDVEALERSLHEVVRRHEVLRTHFVARGGKPVQVIEPAAQIALPVEDANSLEDIDLEAAAREPFDLAHGPLLRAKLYRIDSEDHVALLVMHHIISDGWSIGILVREISELYAALTQDQPSPLPELAIQYADFAAWQREWLQGEVLDGQLAYWREKLAGAPPIIELPTDHPRPAIQSHNGALYDFGVSGEMLDALRTLSREEGATLFMTLLAAFQVVLQRYSGQDDICVGTPIANRNRPEIEGLIGFFVNTLVMRTDLSGQPTFRELIGRVREVALEAYAHQDLPFETLVESIRPQRDLSHTPLFQVMLVLGNTPIQALDLPGLSLMPLQAHPRTATFDITLSMSETPDGLVASIEYNTELFEPETIARLAQHIQQCLQSVIEQPDASIASLSLLTPEEQRQMLVDWNRTAIDFPSDFCAHELFEEHAHRTPDAIALTFDGQTWTYNQINRRANRLARHLQSLGIGIDSLVGISTERGPDMIIGILATLKAGGAYVPLDPTYPQERLAFMLTDAGIAVLLTQRRVLDGLPHQAGAVETVCLDEIESLLAQQPDSHLAVPVGPGNAAYMIYTSGSTGQPKAAVLGHRGLCNLSNAQRRAFGIDAQSRILQFSPFSFDASVWEIFMALANGATLCLAPQHILASGPDMVRLMQDQGVTVVTLPPSVLNILPQADLPQLRTIVSAGEACTPELVQRWASDRQFINAYGPTETTVCASMYPCDAANPESTPIGRPIDNMQLYVLDQQRQPVPVGVPGELYIGGVGVAKGYHRRPELTAERFVPDLFGNDPHARLYRSGDLVRYRPDGNVEFLGRIDNQVKLRGFRIELGEVEAVLRKHPAVQECVAIVREDAPGDRRLVAYLSPQEGAPSVAELREFIRTSLPEYMIPTAFVALETLPHTPNDKIDRHALPAPDMSRPDIERDYVAPRDEIERTLTAICAELLNIERVGIHDNFFELGGHSLLATQFISRVQESLAVELPLQELFQTPTVAALAQRIKVLQQDGGHTSGPTIQRRSRDAYRIRRSQVEETSTTRVADSGE